VIVLISGTNGSGKTYLMRRLLSRLSDTSIMGDVLVTREGKSKPTHLGRVWGPPHDVTVIGAYDDPGCGGCDKFSWKGASDVLEREVVTAVKKGQRVLLEGLIVATWGVERLSRLKDLGLIVVHLNTLIDDCIGSVNDRRRAKAMTEKKEYMPVKEDNIRSKYDCLKRQNDARRRAGIHVEELDREQAFTFITGVLGL
jgi:GTPase SAR1 family protein